MEALITKQPKPYPITYNTYFGPQDPSYKQFAIEIERMFLFGEETMQKKYIAVFNTNPGGNVVARLVPVTTNDLNLSETQILESARRKIIQRVQDSLPDGHEVVGVSNIMPSQYGQGGAYIFPIKIIPPAPPKPVIEMGPAIKSLNDLQDNPPGDARMSSGYYS